MNIKHLIINYIFIIILPLNAQVFSDTFKRQNEIKADGSYLIGDFYFEAGQDELKFYESSRKNLEEKFSSIPISQNKIIESICVSRDNTNFAIHLLDKNGGSISEILVRKKTDNKVASFVCKKENMFLAEVYSVSTSGRYVLTRCGKDVRIANAEQYIVRYNFAILDIEKEKIRVITIDDWHKFQAL